MNTSKSVFGTVIVSLAVLFIPSAQAQSEKVTRAEFIQASFAAKGEPLPQCRRAFRYSDVDWTADYSAALQTFSCMNIVQGNPDGTFRPDAPINYAAAAKIITLAFELPMTREMHSTWYGGYVQTLNRLGAIPRADIMAGDAITRSEMNTLMKYVKQYNTPTDYIGATVKEAQILAEANNVPFRILMLDGEPQIATMDYRIGRINATVENGIVVSYDVEGQ